MLAPGSGTGLLATQCQDNLKVYVCNPMTSTSEIKFVISTLKKKIIMTTQNSQKTRKLFRTLQV